MSFALGVRSGRTLFRSRLSDVRGLTTQSLPDLPYEYSALEPIISAEIMELHHNKHHRTYVTNLNAALDQYAQAETKGNIEKMIQLQPALKFNGGGHVNHSIFWTNLISPKKWEPPSGEIEAAINSRFGSLDELITKFNAAAAGVQGSGWGWIGYNPDSDSLSIATTSNQDPLTTQGLVPLLGIDVWEHAYYLQYQNKRPDYLKQIWKAVNWRNVAERYEAAKK